MACACGLCSLGIGPADVAMMMVRSMSFRLFGPAAERQDIPGARNLAQVFRKRHGLPDMPPHAMAIAEGSAFSGMVISTMDEHDAMHEITGSPPTFSGETATLAAQIKLYRLTTVSARAEYIRGLLDSYTARQTLPEVSP